MGVKRFRRQFALLQAFSKANSKLKKAIVKNADPDFIQALLDITINLLNGNLPNIPKSLHGQLNKRKHMIRCMAQCVHKRGAIKKVQSALSQKGGFIPLLPLLGSIIPFAAKILAPIAVSAIGSSLLSGRDK